MTRNRLRLIYIVVDIIASLIAWTLFMYFRKKVNDANLNFFGVDYMFIPNYNFYSSLLVFPFCCLFVHYLSGIYLYPRRQTLIKLFFSTLISSVIISITIFFALLLDDVVISYTFYYKSLIVLFGILFVITFLFRAFICIIVRYKYKSGQWIRSTLIIGTGKNAQKISKEIQKHSKENKLIGFIAENDKSKSSCDNCIGSLSQIDSIMTNNDVREVIIALEGNDEEQLFSIINSLYHHNIDIRFTPSLHEILTGSVKMTQLGISPLVSITNPSMRDWEACVKRFFDIVMSSVSLVLLLPVFIYYAIRIKADSEGTVFFRQERIGQFGRPFKIVKFRTMYSDAEKGGVPQLSNANDARVTPVGKTLRKYRIDELPQFWNILKGEMSLVGPRPEREYYIKQITEVAPYYCLIYKIRPGLTSWGPIRVGYTDTLEKMVERLNYDIIYMENMSLRTDVKILLYTIEVIFKGKGV